MRRFLQLLFVTIFVALPLSSAFSATFRAEEELSIELPIRDDLYAAGGTVVITEPVSGDLIVGGGEVTVKAQVDQDVVIGGGDISIDSTVGDDMRIAGGSVVISGTIGDDLIIFGGDVELAGDAIVKGDLHVFGGRVVVDGTVRGAVHARGGQVKVLGTIGGPADIRSDEIIFEGEALDTVTLSAKKLLIEPTASFSGDVTYWQPQGEYYFGQATVRGQTIYDESVALESFDEVKRTALGAFQVAILGIAGYQLLSSALIILLLILFTRTYFDDAAKRLQKAPAANLLHGFLYVMVTPMLVFVCLVTIIGIPIGLFIFMLYMFTLYYAKAFTAAILAKWLQQKYKKKWGLWAFFGVSVGVYLALRIVAIVPIIGWIPVWIAVFMAFGAAAYTEWVKYKKVR